jgi:hypothetical protein
LSKKEFLALSKKGQHSYLEQFPKSSHRFLLEKAGSNLKKKDDKPSAKKSESKPKEEPKGADKHLTVEPRKKYSDKPDSEKEAKADQLPAVIQRKEDREQKKKGENYPTLIRHNIGGKSVSVFNPNTPSEKEVRAIRVQEHEQVKNEIAELNKDGSAVINPHSIKALQKIKPHQLAVASRDIDNNREQIINGIAERVQEHPKLFNRGLTAMDKVFQGARKLKPKDAQAGKRVLTQIAMTALLGTSVLALTMGAAPLAVVSARILWDVWMHDKEKRKKEDAQKEREEKDVTPGANPKVGKKALIGNDQLGNKQHQESMRKQGFEWNDEQGWIQPDAEPKQISAEEFAEEGRKKAKGSGTGGKEAKPRKPKKQKHWTEEESEDAEFTTASSNEPFELSDQHHATINTVIDQLTDVLKYQDVDEVKDLGKQLFAGANSQSDSLYEDVYNAVVKLADTRLQGVPGRMLKGVFRVNIDELAEITERLCNVEPEVEIDEGQKVFHFETPRGLVTLGVVEDSDNIQFVITEV